MNILINQNFDAKAETAYTLHQSSAHLAHWHYYQLLIRLKCQIIGLEIQGMQEMSVQSLYWEAKFSEFVNKYRAETKNINRYF